MLGWRDGGCDVQFLLQRFPGIARLLLSAGLKSFQNYKKAEDPPEDLSLEFRLAARNRTHTSVSAATLLVQVKAKSSLLRDLTRDLRA